LAGFALVQTVGAPCCSCLAPALTPFPHWPHLTQLANVLSTEALFYTCIIPFIIFFGAFAFVIYPMREAIHPTGEALFWEGGDEQVGRRGRAEGKD
jgi:hypothetical protein